MLRLLLCCLLLLVSAPASSDGTFEGDPDDGVRATFDVVLVVKPFARIEVDGDSTTVLLEAEADSAPLSKTSFTVQTNVLSNVSFSNTVFAAGDLPYAGEVMLQIKSGRRFKATQDLTQAGNFGGVAAIVSETSGKKRFRVSGRFTQGFEVRGNETYRSTITITVSAP